MQARSLRCSGLAARVSPQTRDRARDPCSDGWILNHWTILEVRDHLLSCVSLYTTALPPSFFEDVFSLTRLKQFDDDTPYCNFLQVLSALGSLSFLAL